MFLTEHGTQIPRGVGIYTIDETVEKWRVIIVPLVLCERGSWGGRKAPPRSLEGEKRGNSEPIYLPGASLFMNLLFYERKSAIRHHLSTPPPLFPFSLFMNLLAELPFTTRGRCTRKSDCASSPLRGSSDNLLRIRLRVEDTLYR